MTIANNSTSAVNSLTTTGSTGSTGSTSGSSSSTSTNSSTALSQLGSQSYFLQLLVAQMNNQDPLNPMDSAQVTSQLAAINTVSGIQTLSTQLTQLLSSVSQGQSVTDTALVGQQVLVPSSTLTLPSGGTAQGAVGLAQAAGQVTITIKNASGQEVRTMTLGAEPAGTTNFTWNGQTDSGAAAAAGQYTYSIAATANGQPVTSTAYASGQVTSISPTSTGTNVNVAGLGSFSVSQVQQIQ